MARRNPLAVLPAGALALLAVSFAPASDWPMLAHDVTRPCGRRPDPHLARLHASDLAHPRDRASRSRARRADLHYIHKTAVALLAHARLTWRPVP